MTGLWKDFKSIMLSVSAYTAQQEKQIQGRGLAWGCGLAYKYGEYCDCRVVALIPSVFFLGMEREKGTVGLVNSSYYRHRRG